MRLRVYHVFKCLKEFTMDLITSESFNHGFKCVQELTMDLNTAES